VGTPLDNAAAVEDDDFVHVRKPVKVVRNEQNRSSAEELRQHVAYFPLALAIESAGGLVQNKDWRIAKKGTGQRNPLPLTTGKPIAVFADDRFQSLRQLLNEV
jgi:hypothetical protein